MRRTKPWENLILACGLIAAATLVILTLRHEQHAGSASGRISVPSTSSSAAR
jgi:hypothetical protein